VGSEVLFDPGDDALEAVVGHLDRHGAEETFGTVFRQALDEVLDGARTGRWMIEDLSKTEKTYVGTKVEILLRAALNLAQGVVLDFLIAGHEVDCKFSIGGTGWMIPIEAQDRLCLLLSANEVSARFSVGLLRCHLDRLNAPNRDGKRSINKAGRNDIVWVFRDSPMPENLLRRLPEATIARIFAHAGRRDGQARIDELFRLVQARIIRREVTVTVARQLDGMKRARDSRLRLRPEGIVVLGHQNEHPRIARELGLPVPSKGELVAARLARSAVTSGPVAVINGQAWRLANQDDPVEAGPEQY
jgi:hypothetical protein